MTNVQLLLETESYANNLQALLTRDGYEVSRCEAPDFAGAGPMIADRKAVERFPSLLEYPKRVVVIAPNDAGFLALLWQHKMKFVVFETDAPVAVLLAVVNAGIGNEDGNRWKPIYSGSITLSPN